MAVACFRAEKSCVQIEVTASFRLRCPVLEMDRLIRKISARIESIRQTSDCRHAGCRA